jgi:hypothetical protein
MTDYFKFCITSHTHNILCVSYYCGKTGCIGLSKIKNDFVLAAFGGGFK